MKIGEYIKFIKQADIINTLPSQNNNTLDVSNIFGNTEDDNKNVNNTLPRISPQLFTTANPGESTLVSDSFSVQQKPRVRLVSQIPPDDVANAVFARKFNDLYKAQNKKPPVGNWLETLVPDNYRDIGRTVDTARQILYEATPNNEYRSILANTPITINNKDINRYNFSINTRGLQDQPFQPRFRVGQTTEITQAPIISAKLQASSANLPTIIHEWAHPAVYTSFDPEFTTALFTDVDDPIWAATIPLEEAENNYRAMNWVNSVMDTRADIAPLDKSRMNTFMQDMLTPAQQTYYSRGSYAQAKNPTTTSLREYPNFTTTDVQSFLATPQFQGRYLNYTGEPYLTDVGRIDGVPIPEVNVLQSQSDYAPYAFNDLITSDKVLNESNYLTNTISTSFNNEWNNSRAWYNNLTDDEIALYAPVLTRKAHAEQALLDGLEVPPEWSLPTSEAAIEKVNHFQNIIDNLNDADIKFTPAEAIIPNETLKNVPMEKWPVQEVRNHFAQITPETATTRLDAVYLQAKQEALQAGFSPKNAEIEGLKGVYNAWKNDAINAPITKIPKGEQLSSTYFSPIPTGGYKSLPGLPEGINPTTPIDVPFYPTEFELSQLPNRYTPDVLPVANPNLNKILSVGGKVLVGADAIARGMTDITALPEKPIKGYGTMSRAEINARDAYTRAFNEAKQKGLSDYQAGQRAASAANSEFNASVVAGAIGGGINRLPQIGLDYTVKAPTDLYNLFQSAKEYAGFTPTYLKSLDGNTNIDTDKVTLYNLLGGDIGGSWGQAYNAVGQGVANTVQIPFNVLYNTFYQTPKDLITGPDPAWAKDQTRYYRPDVRENSMQQFENTAAKWSPEQQEAVYSNMEQSVQRLGNAIEALKQRIANNQKRNTANSKQQLERDIAQFKEKRLRWDNLQLSLAVLRKLNPALGTEPTILNPDYFPNLPDVDDYSTAASEYQNLNQKSQQALQEANTRTPTIDSDAINSEIDAMLEEDEDPYSWMPKRR